MVIDLAQLTMNFDRRCAFYIQNLYHRPHFTVGGCWKKSLHLQPLQRCFCENLGSPTSSFVIRHHYFITYMQSLHEINSYSFVTSGKLTLWTPLLHFTSSSFIPHKNKNNNNINHDSREIDYTADDWKSLAEDREVRRAFVHAAMNLRVR